MRAVLALLCAAGGFATEIPPFNETEAFLYLHYAMATFCDREATEMWSCGTACDEAPVVEHSVRVFGPGAWSGVLGYVAEIPAPEGQTQCLVAFRGSVNANNWIADATMNLVDFPTSNSTHWTPNGAAWCQGCQVHNGFVTAFDELAVQMYRAITDLGCTSTYVTGHSLGAGVATIAAMDIRGGNMQVDQLWTFGSPRVGNDAFVTSFVTLADQQHVSPPSWRVVHYHDPVPTGPPSSQYTHLPVLVYYNTRAYSGDSSGYTVCPWDHATLDEEGNCGANTDAGMTRTLWNQADGLVAVDHTTYLGINVGMKDLEPACVANNQCLQNAGFRTANYTRGTGALNLVLGIVIGGLLGAFLMYQNHKYNKVPMFVAQPPVAAADDGVVQEYERM